MDPSTARSPDAAAVLRLMHSELSTAARIGYTLLLLIGITGAGLLGSLWLTEPGTLPVQTQWAFGLIIAINISWAVLSAWVLSQRKVLYARHRVIAGWMAVVFCTGFLVIGAAIACQRANVKALILIGIVGIAELIVAVALLRRARRRRSELLARRDELCRQLAGE